MAAEPSPRSDYEDDGAWLAEVAPKLLRDEYPDDMARRSCTCADDAVCGAHRLLARYDALYQHLRTVNAERRELRAEVRRLTDALLADRVAHAGPVVGHVASDGEWVHDGPHSASYTPSGEPQT